MDGYQCCIFAYGQTGTGKTHTMQGIQGDEGEGAGSEGGGSGGGGMGSAETDGVQPRALRLLLSKCEEQTATGSAQYTIKVSVLEIYLEKVRDLLDDRCGTASEPKLEVRQGNKEVGNHVPGLTMVTVASVEQIDALLTKASAWGDHFSC